MVFEIIDEPYRKNPRVNVEGKRLSRAFVAECERAFALYNDFFDNIWCVYARQLWKSKDSRTHWQSTER